jgi:hypothetical protein
MSRHLRIIPKYSSTSDWRVQEADGTHLFDIRLLLSSVLNASRYHFLDEKGWVMKTGTFNFKFWDRSTVAQLLTGLVQSACPGAEVEVQFPA